VWKVVVRPAHIGDAAAVANIYLASRRAALPYIRNAHTDEEIRTWVPSILLMRTQVWVAELHGAAVGFFALHGDHLDHLYLQPGYYRRGIGSLLLDKAKDLSPQRLTLWTFQRNERARAFYEAHGFVPVRFTDGSDNEEREPDVLYEWNR
jgi:GNAT superfamily N-acetyltransferase